MKNSALLLILLILICAGAQAQETAFVYDSKDLRDPFVPALPKKGFLGGGITFESGIKLEGVLWDPHGINSQAVINDMIFREGDVFGDMQVLEIENDRVKVKIGKDEFMLEVMPDESLQ